MRGLDVVDIQIPNDPSLAPHFGELRSGPGKKMTDDCNTSTSALVCPAELPDGAWQLDVYHNRFAAQPLPLPAPWGVGIAHWAISDDERGWITMTGST
jgi:hypothetical protein